MKKYLSLLLAPALVCSLAACGNNAATNNGPTPSTVSDPVDTPDTSDEPEETPDASQPEETPGGSDDDSRILIAYFTYGENAPLADGVDATSSASIQYRADGSITGNTGIVADMIAEATGGQLFSILTAEQYPDSYNATIDAGQAEKNNGTMPQLSTPI